MGRKFFIDNGVAHGNVRLNLCAPEELEQLLTVTTVTGDVVVNGCARLLNEMMPMLTSINGSLHMEECTQIKLPGGLGYIGGNCRFRGSRITYKLLEGHNNGLSICGNVFVSSGSELLSCGLPGNVVCNGRVLVDKSRENPPVSSDATGTVALPSDPYYQDDPYAVHVEAMRAQ